MANPEQLKTLKQGVREWNTWRSAHPDAKPDLTHAHLARADLSAADFGWARLNGADFKQADLHGANFFNADLQYANLNSAVLNDAALSQSLLRGGDLRDAKLLRAQLTSADLLAAKMVGADLSQADLTKAILIGADLSRADLTEAKLLFTNLTSATLRGANLNGALCLWTLFANIDLTEVMGLEAVIHKGPCPLGIDTIYKSKGKIPESFLRGAGVPDSFIEYMKSLTGDAIEYYSCFISYSSMDQEFADRLYADLQNKGVRCWFAPEDMKIGDKIRDRLDESIRIRDKLLLILSETSVASQWVEQEVETALEEERKRGKTVLFPVRLDDAVFSVDKGWPNLLKNSRHIGDFTDWKNHDSYQQAFDRLLRDLKAG